MVVDLLGGSLGPQAMVERLVKLNNIDIGWPWHNKSHMVLLEFTYIPIGIGDNVYFYS